MRLDGGLSEQRPRIRFNERGEVYNVVRLADNYSETAGHKNGPSFQIKRWNYGPWDPGLTVRAT